MLDLTKGDVRRVEKNLSIPFGELLADFKRLGAEVLGSRDKFFDLLWVLIEPQATAAGIDLAAFEDGYNGPTEDAAAAALVEAVVDFSPVRRAKNEMLQAIRTMETKGLEVLTQRIRTATAEMEAASPSTPTDSVSSSPPSPELTATG